MTRIAIVGARDAPPETLDEVRALVRSLPPDTVVISGGAPGVDTVAVQTARDCGLATVEYSAERTPRADVVRIMRALGGDWYDAETLLVLDCSVRDALICRNTLIAITCERMHAFVRGSRGGSHDAIRQARRFRRAVEVHP